MSERTVNFEVAVKDHDGSLAEWLESLPGGLAPDSHPAYGTGSSADGGPGMVFLVSDGRPDRKTWRRIARMHFFRRKISQGIVVVSGWQEAADEWHQLAHRAEEEQAALRDGRKKSLRISVTVSRDLLQQHPHPEYGEDPFADEKSARSFYSTVRAALDRSLLREQAEERTLPPRRSTVFTYVPEGECLRTLQSRLDEISREDCECRWPEPLEGFAREDSQLRCLVPDWDAAAHLADTLS